MGKPKKQSKRVSLSRRYNIQKKAKEAERKAKKQSKSNPTLRKKLKKDPGIPNLHPYKAEILKRLEDQSKLLKFTEQQRQRRAQDAAVKRRLLMKAGGGGGELAALALDAAARGQTFEASDGGHMDLATGEWKTNNTSGRAGENTRRAFYRHVKAMLEKADILLEVLDARDPLACRAYAVEQLALAMDPPKRIVLVLNKIDLVPADVVQAWLQYLRKEFPCIAFKASTQQQRSNLSAAGGAVVNKATEHGEVLTGSGAAGADTLLQLIKNYSRSRDLKTAVTVGVVGYPNVGKSSVINSLKRSKAVGVSSMPGFTRTLQEVQLDSKVTLIDCPGVIFDDDAPAESGEAGASSSSSSSSSPWGTGGDQGASLLLRNCISVDSIEDPEAAVEGILNRCSKEKLMVLYSIGAFADCSQFLAQVAVKRGKVGKGGVADKTAAARMVLQDWNSGKIPFFVLPPGAGEEAEAEEGDIELEAAAATGAAGKGAAAAAGAKVKVEKLEGEEGLYVDSAAIVASWSKEFDLEALMKAEADMLAAEGAAGGAAAAASSSAANVANPAAVKAANKASKLRKQQAAAAMAEILAADEDDDEDDDEYEEDDDEEMEEEDDDEDEDDDEEDDDSEEDDDDEDDEEMEEEEVAKPAAKKQQAAASAPAGKKAVSFKGAKPPAPAAPAGKGKPQQKQQQARGGAGGKPGKRR